MKRPIKPCPFCKAIPSVDTSEREMLKDPDKKELIIRQRILIRCKQCACTKDLIGVRRVPLNTSEKECNRVARSITRVAIDAYWNKRE